MTNEIMEAYMEDTKGRKYHQNIITKAKQDITPTASEVTTFMYDRPILYNEFIELSPELRKYYLTYIFGKFQIGRKHLAKAMRVNDNTFGWQCHFLGVKTKRVTKQNLKSIDEFWKWWGNPLEETVSVMDNEEDGNCPDDNEAKHEPIDNTEKAHDIKVSDFSITLTGIKQITDISVLLDFINEGYEITVTAKKI